LGGVWIQAWRQVLRHPGDEGRRLQEGPPSTHSQYSVLFSGSAKYPEVEGGRREVPLVKGETAVIEGAPTYSWWRRTLGPLSGGW